MRGHLDVSFSFGNAGPPSVRGGVLRVLLVGDFAAEGPGGHRPRRVDVDALDGLVASLAPRLSLVTAAGPLSLSFAKLEDFHPDELLARVGPLQALAQTRQALERPDSFAAAAARLLGPSEPRPALPDAAAREAPGPSLFSSLLGANVAAPAPPASDAVTDLLRRVVAPHVIPEADPQLAALLTAVEASASALLREILHTPAFQQLESAWRGLERLVAHIPPEARVELWVASCAASDLHHELASTEDPSTTRFAELLAGNEAFSVIALAHPFGSRPEELSSLARAASLAAARGALLLADAQPGLFGGSLAPASTPAPVLADLASAWSAFRRGTAAAHVALVAPRWLLRLPYGPRRNEVQGLRFDELGFSGRPDAASLLWGAGAWALVEALACAFAEDPHAFPLEAAPDLEDLPALVYEEGGERELYPATEAWLSEAQVAAAVAAGLIPFVADRRFARARLARLQTAADPPQPLAVALMNP
ncbi:MAG: type VI secretion system contractile sheath large subunit [Myxococcales bacterium]|nr:type VI secretion system contractile sheath large subunit [Myxococcales bacterium]